MITNVSSIPPVRSLNGISRGEIALIAIAIRPAGYTWLVCVQRSGMYVWDQAQNVVWIWYVQEVEYRVIMCEYCEGGGRRG